MNKTKIALFISAIFLTSCSLNQKDNTTVPSNNVVVQEIENPNYKKEAVLVESMTDSGATLETKVAVNQNIKKLDSSCQVSTPLKAHEVAYQIAADLINRLQLQNSKILIAPTIIETSQQKCIGDLSFSINKALKLNSKLDILDASKSKDYIKTVKASASARVIPELIRSCKNENIPYLISCSVRTINDTPAVSLRIIRTIDGITLSQSTKKIN